MPTLVNDATLERLQEYDRLLDKWIEVLRAEAEQLDPGQIDRLIRTAKTLGQRLSADLPPTLDPHAAAEIRGILLDGYRWLDEEDRPPLDILNDFMIRSEALRHIVRDALDEDLPPGPRTTQAVLRLLRTWLPSVRNRDIATLLGIDVRSLPRWRTYRKPAPARLVLVARLVNILRLSWTPAGVVAWFLRSRPELDGRAPISLLDDPASERILFAVARQGRAQHGA